MEPKMPNNLNYKEILLSLGYKLKDDGKFWRCRSLYRNGKNETSLSICKDSGVWTDYGAGTEPKPFAALMQLHGVKDFKVADPEIPTESVDEIEDPQMEKIYPESVLERLLPHYKFYNERGISTEVLKTLRSGMASSGKMYQRYVFPIFDKSCKIVGFSGRDMSKNKDRPKWKHIGKKKNWVYPLYVKDSSGKFFVKEAIEKTGEIILVESIGDLISLHSRGVFNVLVSFGLKISPASICAILELAPEKITIAYNNDFTKGEFENNGKNAAISNFLELLKYFDYNSIRICLPEKNDFGEMNEIDIQKWLLNKESTDFDAQREEICTLASILNEKKKISDKIFKNIKLLDCA